MRSVASYVPSNCVGNTFFSDFLDTSDEWITQRTGIKTRHFSDGELASDLGSRAAEIAVSRAGINMSDIDLLMCATLSPDYYGMPSTACLIASKLGMSGVPAFDVTAACSGFIYLLSVANAYVQSGAYKHILIVGAERISSVLDFSDRSTCVLFGDGAGACVISRSDRVGILDVLINSDGDYANLLCTPCKNTANYPPISRSSATRHASAVQDQYIKMDGNKIFKLAVRTISNSAKHIMEKNNIAHDDISYFIPHQANYRIIMSVAKNLGISPEKTILTVDRFGNTSAASIPMAIDFSKDRFKRGDLLLLDAFGGGLTWGSALVYADFV